MLYEGDALFKDASVSATRTKSVILLDECRNYTVEVAAFTTPGTGPNSTLNVISSCPCGTYVCVIKVLSIRYHVFEYIDSLIKQSISQ